MNAFELAARIAEMAKGFEALSKTAPEIRAAMEHLREGTSGKNPSWTLDPKHVDSIRKGLFTDRGTGHIMGNQGAYEDFMESLNDPNSPNQGGVHVRMDANDFKSINSTHGYKTGDDAIHEMGQHIRAAADEALGKESHGKLFRLGGDEFHFHAPDHETAANFIGLARKKLSSLAPLGGTHNWSMSYGFGAHPYQADEALTHAKARKKDAEHPVGQAEHYAHSLVPGMEGPVPISEPTTLKIKP